MIKCRFLFEECLEYLRRPYATLDEGTWIFDAPWQDIRREIYRKRENIYRKKEAKKAIKGGFEPGCQKVTGPLYERVKEKDPVTKMQYLDMHLWLVHDILMKGDKMGMANSLEVRVPFLDKEVMKLAQTLPLKYKVNAPKTKIALRAAAERVIQSKTAEKEKTWFSDSDRVWLREDKYYNRVKQQFSSKEAEQFFNTSYLLRLLEEHKAGNRTAAVKNTYGVDSVWYDRYFANGKPVHPVLCSR